MKNFIKEFREFAVKGNAIELAIGVIVATSFGKIITSLVNDLIMPPLGLLLGGADFAHKEWVLRAAHDDVPAVAIKYGLFVNSIVDFLIVVLVIFLVIKQVNRFNRWRNPAENAAAQPSHPHPTDGK